MGKPLHWRQLGFDRPVSPADARAVLIGMATIPGQPRLVLEAVARGHTVDWRIGADEHVLPKLRTVFRAHLPDVSLRRASSTFSDIDIDRAASVAAGHSRTLPLRHDVATLEQVTRQLFDVFASTAPSDLLRLQLILGPRTTPKRAPVVDGVNRTVIEGKFGQYGFGCALRIAARAGHPERTRQLLSATAACFRVLELPGIRLDLRYQGKRAIHDLRSPFFWPLWLSVDDLVALTGWPVIADRELDLPALPPRHPKLLPASKTHPRKGRPFGDAADAAARGITRRIAQDQTDALRHTHILGLNGTGKSTVLAHLVLDDLHDGRGAVLIDPKGDLVDDILARAPKDRLDDIVVLDPRHAKPVGINPLIGHDPELAADSLLTVFHTLFEESWGPRTSDILHASLLTLARRGDASLVMVPLLLTNPGFRRSIVQREAAKDPLGLGTFWATFESWSDGERAQAIQPLMNKLRTVLLRPTLRGIFGQRTPRFDLSDVFTKNKVLLVALGKGSIGIEGARLLGSLVTTQLWHTVLARTNVSPEERTPVNVYIDEVQDFIAGLGDLGDALATARGFGVGFTIAHQELGQLREHRGAVLANARSRLVFQPSPADARDLASGFAPGVLEREDFRALGAYQAYAQVLVGNALTPWVSVVTRPLPAATRRAATVRRASASRYGTDLDAVERDLLALTQARPRAPRGSTATDTSDRPPDAPQDVPDTSPRTPGDPRTESFGRRRPTPPTEPKGGPS